MIFSSLSLLGLFTFRLFRILFFKWVSDSSDLFSRTLVQLGCQIVAEVWCYWEGKPASWAGPLPLPSGTVNLRVFFFLSFGEK